MALKPRHSRVTQVPAYSRNDVEAPSFDIITDQGRVRSWSSSGGAECARRLIEACHARGGRVLSAWINPGPDFCGAIVAPVLLAAE